MKRVVTLGEILLRLSPPDRNRIIGSQSFDVNYGGSEGNVAVALSHFGIDTALITKLPDNPIADAAIQQLRGFGVNTDLIIRGGERMGLYYLENGYSVRSSRVVYDRKHSSISEAEISEFNFDQIFENVDLFHVSGITLGISEEAYLLAKSFMEEANRRRIKVSFDFNYRSKLWTTDEAKAKFSKVLPYVNIAFAGVLDFTTFLGIDPEETSNLVTKMDHKKLYKKVNEHYQFDYIVSSYRTVISASHNEYQGLVFNGEEAFQSKKYQLDIIDRVGAGDAFTAGFLYSYLCDKEEQYQVQFAAAAGALKHTIFGDALLSSKEEVENLFQSNTYHVQR